jgi:pyruvate carboxylase
MSKLSVQDVLIMSGPIYILLLLLFSSSSTDGFVNDNRYLATGSGSGSGSSRLFSQIEDQSSSSSSYTTTTTTSKNKYQNIITTSSSDDDDDWVEKSLSKQTTAPTFSSSKLASFVKGPKECLVFDTTLRDGTQGELVSASCDDKLKIATRLAAFDVDYIEAGWPGSNPKVRFMLLY